MPPSSSRAFSPPHSTISSIQSSASPVQIKKVVVEGRSKHDGASLRMYIKLSVAVDNTLPGASIPLFPENNVRITQSKVHPLDERSVPYHFSATEQPLLQKTAIALQLGPKSSRSYHTLFPHFSPPLDPTTSSSFRRSRDGHPTNFSPPHNDENHTGYILVSGYNITLVLPKEFPPKPQTVAIGAESDGDENFVKDVQTSWLSRSARRPSSFFHKNYLHMMAGIELFIPYVLTPPKGPFLISIPVPRCLDNHLKLRISTPPVGSSPPGIPRGSFTSTSSEDDTPGWDFLTDPPVSRKFDKSVRRPPYRQSVDDEQSDTPTIPSAPGTELIQGAYQSTDVLHVRWAPPLGKRSAVSKGDDGMRRANVERTFGQMKTEVLGRDQHNITLGITYNGVCTGLWHPGVATILCMDIALDVKGRRVSWIDDTTTGWAVSGNDAFGGLHTDVSAPSSLYRKPSFDSGSSTFLPTLASKSMITPTHGSASLLRAPLPNENAPDYSFENSPNVSPSNFGTSSNQSAAAVNQDTRMTRPDIPPGKAVTLTVNLLKLLPPAKNELSFRIQGIVVIDTEEEDFVPLPTFHVLGSDSDKVDNVISSHMTDAIVQVGSQVESSPRRTLRVGEEVRCEEGVGLVLRSWESPGGPSSSPSTSNIPVKQATSLRSTNLPPVVSPTVTIKPPSPEQPSRLSCVSTTITPLVDSPQHTHCVRMNIPVYSLDRDTIEFGLALPQQSVPVRRAPVVDVLFASFAGRLVPVELRPQGTTSKPSKVDMSAESQIIGEMQYLVVVHLEDVEADAGPVEVVYLVGEEHDVLRSVADKSKGKGREDIDLDVLLPCFQLPVAQYQVQVDYPSSFTLRVKYSTLPHYHVVQTGAPKLVHFRLPAGFFPILSLSLVPSEDNFLGRKWTRRRVTTAVYSTVAHLTILSLLFLVISMGSEVRQVRDTMNAAAQALANGVPYSDIYWGGGGDPFDNNRWWTPEQFVPTMTTEHSTAASTSVTSGETEIVHLVTPTINLAEATRRPERRSQTTVAKGSTAGALVPLPAVSFLSLKLPISTKTKELIVQGFMKVWYIVRKAWNFPVDPD